MTDIHCPFCQSTNWRHSGSEQFECLDCGCEYTKHDIMASESNIYRIAYNSSMFVSNDHASAVAFAESKVRMHDDPKPLTPDSYFENEPESMAEKERRLEWRQWQRER